MIYGWFYTAIHVLTLIIIIIMIWKEFQRKVFHLNWHTMSFFYVILTRRDRITMMTSDSSEVVMRDAINHRKNMVICGEFISCNFYSIFTYFYTVLPRDTRDTRLNAMMNNFNLFFFRIKNVWLYVSFHFW